MREEEIGYGRAMTSDWPGGHEKDWPIGPGFENFFEELAEWVKGQDLAGLHQLGMIEDNFLRPWLLQHTPLVKSREGMMSLLPYLDSKLEEGPVQARPNQAMVKLLENPHLTKQSWDILVEWSLSALFADEYEKGLAAELFFREFAKKGYRLNFQQRIRVQMEMLRIKTIKQNKIGDRWLASVGLIPDVANVPALRELALEIAGEDELYKILAFSKGKNWLELALRLANKTSAGVMGVFKLAGKRNIEGLNRQDLGPLLMSKNKEVRQQALRLATLVESPGESMGRKKAKY